ncbi:MAG: CHAT domain-containing protein [Terriglobia bacterium]
MQRHRTRLPIFRLSDADGKYVLNTHVVSYGLSTTALCFFRNRQRRNRTEMAFLGIGEVPYDLEPPSAGGGASRGALRIVARGVCDISGAHPYHLQAARQELLDANGALGRPKESLLLLGGHATETKFKSEPLSDFMIIHFAVHGISAPHFPETQLLSTNDSGQRNRLLDDLTEAEVKFGYVNDMLNPVQRRVATRPISLTAAQESILPDETILEYVLQEPASYCLALTRTHAEIVKLPAGRGVEWRAVVSASARLDCGSAQSGDLLQFRAFRKPPDECLVTGVAALAKSFKFRQHRLLRHLLQEKTWGSKQGGTAWCLRNRLGTGQGAGLLHPEGAHLAAGRRAGGWSAKLRSRTSRWCVHCCASGCQNGNPALIRSQT